MRYSIIVLATVAITVVLGSQAGAEIKRVAYPEVDVTVEDAYEPDAAFEAMRKNFADAVTNKDAAALFALVGPTFLWMQSGSPSDEFDMGRDALHNFKVLFGFRAAGKDVDGDVEGGPYWETLAEFATDATYNWASDAGNFVCGPVAADVVNEDVYNRATDKLQNGDELPEWYFTLIGAAVAKAPGDTGAPLAKVGKVALPLLSVYPAAKEGQPAPRPTHFEVLLPSGKSGFIPASAARPLFSDHLCYAKTANGEWRISAYDQAGQ